MSDEFTLPPPGIHRVEVPNLGPVIDPPFSDARDWSVFLTPIETRPVDYEEGDPPLSEEGGRRALELALASDQLKGEIEGKRHEVIGVGLRSLDRETEHPLVVIYDYTDDVAVEALVDLDAGTVMQVSRERYQPPLTAGELSRALELARDDRRLRDAGIDYDTGSGLLVDEVNFRSPRHGHRLVDLRFGPEDRRIPTAYAIVDLSSQDVVTTGVIEEVSQ